MIVDADAHVIENDATWDHLETEHKRLRPYRVHPPGSERQHWFIDGKTRGLGSRILDPGEMAARSELTGRQMRVPLASRDLEDIEARLAHMSELGIDVQVLLPTTFLEQIADRPEVEVPLCRAYNRWLADIWRRGGGRLRWTVVPPLLAMDEALRELRTGKEHGACGVFLRPIEGGLLLTDPYFSPLYRAAGELELAVTVHVGNGNPLMRDFFSQYHPGASFWKFRMPLMGAFHALAMAGVPDAFPRVRWGFLEAGAEWLPVALSDLRRRLKGTGRTVGREFLSRQHMFVSCQADEDLAYLLQCVGEDCLVMGTDYGHADTASDLEGLRTLQGDGRLSADAVSKILSANPRRLYGL